MIAPAEHPRHEPGVRAAVVLSLYWFTALGGLGIFFPFYSLYLSENAGLTGSQVGLVMATMPLVGMLAQPFWGQVADRTGARRRVLSVLGFGAAAGYALLYLSRGFHPLLAGTAALALFSNSLLPMGVSVSLASLRHLGPHAFGIARAWGTVGFLVTVVAFPKLLDWVQASQRLTTATAGSSEPGLELILPCTSVCVLAAAIVSLVIPSEQAFSVPAAKGDWRLLLRHPPFMRLLLFTFGGYLFLQGPMVLFPIFVRSLGGGIEVVSRMWVCMLLLEIPLIALSGAGLERVGPRGLILIGISAGALRWLVCGLSSSLSLIYAVQVLHGVTVMGLVIGAPLYVDAVVPAQLRSTGQGLLAMVGISLGGILSNLSVGWLFENAGGSAPALFAGVGATALALALPWALPEAAHVHRRGVEEEIGTAAP
jgi:PPP family 3-phenylpropionic acid transporter